MKYRHEKYTWEKPFGSVRHMWQLIGPKGGIHFAVSLTPEYSPACGLEIHSREPQWDRAPDQNPCWLIGAPCWHDGTSLYASDVLWPEIEKMLRRSDHEAIFRVLEHEADKRFAPEDGQLVQE